MKSKIECSGGLREDGPQAVRKFRGTPHDRKTRPIRLTRFGGPDHQRQIDRGEGDLWRRIAGEAADHGRAYDVLGYTVHQRSGRAAAHPYSRIPRLCGERQDKDDH